MERGRVHKALGAVIYQKIRDPGFFAQISKMERFELLNRLAQNLKIIVDLGGQPQLIKNTLHGRANSFVVLIDRYGILCAARFAPALSGG